MPKQTTHPSPEELSAFNLGQLPPDAAAVVESHISECHPCCETMLGLSSDDTFVGLLQEAKQLPTDRTIDLGGLPAKPSSSLDDVPAPLAEHPRYEIVGTIGRGGMGDVYKARHRMMDRTVALKIIKRDLVRKPEAVDRFHREVKTAAQLSHPNIVTAYDAEQAGDVHFLVMEHVDGTDLSRITKDRGSLPIDEACDYIRQAAIGLQYAHERGMVHRDIKPHNLMVTADGTVKVLDFGLASLAPEASSDVDTTEARGDLTAAGAIMGTPDFISPEQADDARQADIRSDIYSLGASLYFLLSGRPLFTDGSVMQKLKSHAQAEPEALESLRDDIPAELAAVASKMIAKDPDERFQTPAEVAAALETFSRASRPAEQQSPRHQLQPRRDRSRVLPFTAVAMLFVAATVAAVVYYIQTNKGTVRVEVTDESLEVTINNQTITMKDGNKEPLEIRATEHTLIVRQRDSEFEFETDNFEVRRNREIAFKVELLDGQVVVSKGGKKFKSKALRSAEPLDFNTELGNANQIETGGRAIEKVSATALVNGCEVTGGFTVEQAEITVKNPTREAREVSFYYQVVYQNSRDRDDIFQLRGGFFKETVPPGREAIKRVDTLPDPNASMPVNFMKDLLVIRISQERLKEFTDIPIQPTKKLDIANQPVTIASQATPGYPAAAEKRINDIRPEEDLTADELIRRLTAKHGDLVPKLQKMFSEAAGIPNAQWSKFASDPSGATDAIKGEPLSLVLWKLNPLQESTKNLMVLEDFQYIGGIPKPRQLSDAMFPSHVDGHYSMIQPHYISGLTFDLKQGTTQLKGNFRFRDPNLYAGKIDYVVQIEGDDLRVVEFILPNYGIRLVRGRDGLWTGEDVATLAASSDNVRQSNKHREAANTVRALTQILDAFKVQNGSYPTTEAGWNAVRPFLKEIPVDPWGNAFGYEIPGTRGGDDTKPKIWSWGPDGIDNTDDDIRNWEPDREGSSARIILDQGYTIIDAGTSIGSRRLVVTKNAQTLSIVEEYSLALKWEGAPLGIVERDFSADYSLAGDTPLILRGTTSTKEQGSLVMHGTVEFTSGEALTRWTSYTERGRKLETPSKQQVTVKPPSGPLVLGSTIQVVGPLLLPGDGERKIVLGNFDDHTPAGKPLVEYETGCRLRRTARPEGAGFTITLFKPDSKKPEMIWEYDSKGNCESIQLGSTTVMKPHDSAPRADEASSPDSAKSETSTKRKTTAFLVEAAKSGDLDAVNAALKAGVDPNGPPDRLTALHWAVASRISEGKTIEPLPKIAERLIEAGADVNAKDYLGQTPLEWAAKYASPDVVEMLIEAGADVNAESVYGTILIAGGRIEIAKLLIEAGADVTAGKTMTPLANAAKYGNVALIRLLIENEVQVNDPKNPPIHWAGKPEVAKALLEAGADVNQRNGKGETVLHLTGVPATYGPWVPTSETVKALIEAGADVNAKSKSGSTPLHAAVLGGKSEISKLLIAASADVDAKDKQGNTPLSLARAALSQTRGRESLDSRPYESVVQLLVDAGATNDGRTPLQRVVETGQLDEVKKLIASKVDVNETGPQRITALHIASEKGHGEILAALLEAGAKVDQPDVQGMRPMHFAANADIAQTLIASGAKVDSRSPSPLYMATANGKADVVRVLIRNEANVKDSDCAGMLNWATFFGQIEVVKVLLEQRDGNTLLKASDNESPLFIAASGGFGDMNCPKDATPDLRLEIAKLLVSKGADVNTRWGANVNPQSGAAHMIDTTPLMFASSKGEPEMVKLLLERGANVKAANASGQMALHFAAERGHRRVVELLMDAEATPNPLNRGGKTPLDLAQDAEVKVLLIQNGGKTASEVLQDSKLPKNSQ